MDRMVWEFVEAFGKIRGKQSLFADDSIDKLNRTTTLILAIIVAIFVGAKNLGITIRCIDEPFLHQKIDMKYVDDLCFAKETYTLNNYSGKNEQNYKVTSIYPWLPFVALAMGLCFYVPYLIWKIFVRQNTHHHMPVDVSAVIEFLKKSCIYKKNEFYDNIKVSSEYLDQCFSLNNFNDGYVDEYEDSHDEKSNKNKQPKKYRDRRSRRIQLHIPLVVKYIFIKLLYLFISILLFFITGEMLHLESKNLIEYFSFGHYVFSYFVNKNKTINDYLGSKYFPRIVFCDVHARIDHANNIQTIQYQCALPANVFNEKAFVLLWSWFLLMIVFNAISLFRWIIKIVFRRKIITEMLLWPLAYNYEIDKHADSFIYEYLSTEGFFVLMLIKSNTKDWYCRAILRLLWKFHLNRTTCELNASYLRFHNNENRNQNNGNQNQNNEEMIENQFYKTPTTEKALYRRDLNANNFGQNLELITPIMSNETKQVENAKQGSKDSKESLKLKKLNVV